MLLMDIPPLRFTPEQIENLIGELPELPLEKYMRYKKELGLTEAESLRLSEEPALAEFFEIAIEKTEPKKIANLLLSVVLAKINWKQTDITPEHLIEVVDLIDAGKISSTSAKQIIEAVMETGKSAVKLMDELGLEQVSNIGQLEEWVDCVLEENESTVAEFRAGKEKVLGFLVGQVMKMSAGSANPPVVQEMLLEKLKGEE